MSISISKIEGDKRHSILKLGSDSWALPELFKIFENWLMNESGDIDPQFEWIVDIGFSPREGASGGGPIISKTIMKKCIEKNISIYLSEYADQK